jgi:hypothetical protein
MSAKSNENTKSDSLSFEQFKTAVIKDYTTAAISREASLLGRKEVLTG